MAAVKKNVHYWAMENKALNKIVLAIPAIALLLLGAHALRQGDFGLTASFVILAGGLFVRQAWLRLTAICALLWGGYIWADATVQFISFRQAFDLPWQRLFLIMIGLVVFDGLALLALVSRFAREYYTHGVRQGVFRASIVVLVSIGLAVARAKVSFPILLADRFFPGWGWLEIAFLAVYAQWVGGMMLASRGHRRIRPRIWLLFSGVFLDSLFSALPGWIKCS